MSDASYIANIKVEKIAQQTNRSFQPSLYGGASRNVVQTIKLTIKASSIEKLQAKVSAHIALLDEEDL